MQTYQVNILNPKAVKLLQDLADLELISIRQTKEDAFQRILDRLRSNAASDPITLEEITEEVEAVRAERYERNQG